MNKGTTAKARAHLVQEIRHLTASTISNMKAYEVPGLCTRVGLETGEEAEAFSSKYKYAQKRLALLNADRLVDTARKLLEELHSYNLSEAVAKFDELAGPDVTELTRKRLVALFDARPLCTECEPIELLQRVWPLAEMRSATDPSDYDRTLEEAIFQHTVRNDDWTNRDLFAALGFAHCSRAQLFRFLAAVVDPLAQITEDQQKLVALVNEHLKHDGYALVIVDKISGSPRYEVTILKAGSPADAGISAALAAFSPDDVHPRWTAAMERRESEPQGAITLARTLLEDVCKWILDEAQVTYKDEDDLPALYRKLAKVLKLAPDDHTEQVFKQILGSCQSVVESLGALRNKLSDAHSLGPKRARPHPRHAELAVNLSGAMATFLVSTWQARQDEKAACGSGGDAKAADLQ